MKYVEVPNLPSGPVRLMLVDGRLDRNTESALLEDGINLIRTDCHTEVYAEISGHPDIMLHHLGGNRIVFAPGISPRVLDELSACGFELIGGSTPLSPQYPADIAYNVARVGNLAFHNFNYTDPVLKSELQKMGIRLVNVAQGYSKCSISVIEEKCIITADRGIEKAALENGIEVLLLKSDEGIELPGMNTGFIGGGSGLADRNVWALAGSIRTLRSADRILHFLGERDIRIKQLNSGAVHDLGSLIPLACDE